PRSRTARAVPASCRSQRPAEPLVHAVVILPAALVALLLGQGLPGAMSVAHCESDARGHRTQSALAHREGDRDIEVAVEAIPLVESADRDQGVTTRRLAVALDRVADTI